MKKIFNKIFGRKEQGETPVFAEFVVAVKNINKEPQRLSEINEIVDDETIKANIQKFNTVAETLVGSVIKNGEYRFDINGNPPVLKELGILAEKTKSICEAIVSFAKAPYTQYRIELETRLAQQTDEDRRDYFLDQNGESITCEISEAEKPLLDIKSKKIKVINARNRKEEAWAKRDKISKDQYGGFSPEKGVIHGFLYWIIAAFIIPTETVLNFGALDVMESDLQVWFIAPTALTITMMIAGAAHFLGFFIGNKSHKGLILTAFITAALMLGMVFYIRINGVESAFVLTFINLAAFILMSGLSFYRYKDSKYHTADESFNKWQDEESQLEHEIALIEKTAEDTKTGILNKWKAKATTAVNEQIKPLKLEILQLVREEEVFDVYLKTHVIEPIDVAHKDYSTRAEINFIKARKKNGLDIPVVSSPKDDLVEEYEVETVSDVEINGKPFGGMEDLQKGFYSILAVLCFFCFTACTEQSVRQVDIVFIGDGSIEVKDSIALPSVDQNLSFVFDSIEFKPYSNYTEVVRDKIRVQVMAIGETSFPPIQTFALSAGESMWRMVKSKRRAEQKSFVENIRPAVQESMTPLGLPSSHVFDCLCRVLPPLVKSGADKKMVLMISDLLELSEVENFYKLSSHMPNKLQKIADRFESHCPGMKDLSLAGINFTAVYLPDKERDKVTRYSRMFWEMYFQSKGGQIDFLPNLPKANSQRIVQY